MAHTSVSERCLCWRMPMGPTCDRFGPWIKLVRARKNDDLFNPPLAKPSAIACSSIATFEAGIGQTCCDSRFPSFEVPLM